jgi:hypothetical protein
LNKSVIQSIKGIYVIESSFADRFYPPSITDSAKHVRALGRELAGPNVSKWDFKEKTLRNKYSSSMVVPRIVQTYRKLVEHSG